MLREFRRVAGEVRGTYTRNQMLEPRTIEAHQERVRAILTEEIDPLIATMGREVAKGLDSRTKSMVLLERKQDEEEDDNEALAALLLLLIGRLQDQWQESRIIPVSTQIANTTRRQAERAVERQRQAEADEIADTIGGATPGTAVTVDEGAMRRRGGREVEDVLVRSTRGRAGTIGQTESGTAASTASNGAVTEIVTGQTGVQATKIWTSRQDDRVRDFEDGDFSHVEADGQEQPLDQPYQIPKDDGSTEALRFPRDPNGSPGNVINCRCVETYRIQGAE